MDERLKSDPALAELCAIARARSDGDPGHDVEHALRVARWTIEIGNGCDPRECIAAALLHDVINVPKNDPRRAQASQLCAAEARAILPRVGFEPAQVERIAEAIEDHSYSRGAVPRSPLGDALQDADRLEALGALGLMRTISTGARMGARYFHADDPFAESGRELDDRAYSIDHFYAKLLKLPATMRTAKGRAEAERRAAFLIAFLDQLRIELSRPRAT